MIALIPHRQRAGSSYLIIVTHSLGCDEPHGQRPVAIFWGYLAPPPEASVDLLAAIDWLSNQPYVHQMYIKGAFGECDRKIGCPDDACGKAFSRCTRSSGRFNDLGICPETSD
jgi:hypothetical protein